MNFLLLFTNSLPPSDKSELVLDWTNYFQHKYIQKEWKSIWKEMVLVFTLPFYWCAWSLSRVQLLATPCTVAHQGPSVHGILQARVLEWAAMPSPRGSSLPRDRTQVSCTAGDSLPSETPERPTLYGNTSKNLTERWERGPKGRGYMYKHSWFMWFYSRP